jgi:hypothetical protein
MATRSQCERLVLPYAVRRNLSLSVTSAIRDAQSEPKQAEHNPPPCSSKAFATGNKHFTRVGQPIANMVNFG